MRPESMNPVTATKAPSVIANAPRLRITTPRPRTQFCATAFKAILISEERLCLLPAGRGSGCAMDCRDEPGNDSGGAAGWVRTVLAYAACRSEEHTSELQSL